MSERELDPAHLLTVCQELLLAQPPSLDDSHAVAASLLQLLSELAPHLADKGHTPHLGGRATRSPTLSPRCPTSVARRCCARRR